MKQSDLSGDSVDLPLHFLANYGIVVSEGLDPSRFMTTQMLDFRCATMPTGCGMNL